MKNNYPDPFQSFTTIEFQLKKASEVSLQVYNLNGNLVYTSGSRFFRAGTHSVKWEGSSTNGNNVKPGNYLYQLLSPAGTTSGKMIFLGK